MNILVINCGSSSIKYQLFDMRHHEVVTSGLLERIGERSSRLEHEWIDDNGDTQEKTYEQHVDDHHAAFELIRSAMRDSGISEDLNQLDGVGHRVVHGGEAFQQPVMITDEVVASIREVCPLAPLHNPANLTGIEIAKKQMPNVPHVAVFDTAFHHTMPPHSYRYALPETYYREHGVRRYGFHGTSHYFVAKKAAAHLNRSISELKLITLHLGNGASAAAIKHGKSVDTSMGLTPLEGLIMGTRSGDIDPAIPFYLEKEANLTINEIDELLNKQSGLKGICGANDMREIQNMAKNNDEKALLAIDMYCYRIKKYIGAYYAVLGGLDALIFTAGIGENSAMIREKVCSDMAHLGIECDPAKNRSVNDGVLAINSTAAGANVLVVPTNEELEIAQQTAALI
jgi:acetate kinase